MSADTLQPLFELPLLLCGVPAPVEWWLRLAGVPVAPADSLADGSGFAGNSQFRFLLCDTRVCSGETLRRVRPRCEIALDVGRLDLPQPSATQTPNTSAAGAKPRDTLPLSKSPLSKLKKAIEQAGGTWARVAELPYPYQGLRQSGSAIIRSQQGLEWQTTPGEFNRWWQVRSQLELSMQKQGDEYRIQCRGTTGGFRAAVEIWRGDHAACVPLTQKSIGFSEHGLVFLRGPSPSTAVKSIEDRLRRLAEVLEPARQLKAA